MKNIPITITFDKEDKKNILNIFNKTVDKFGYIVEKKNLDRKVLTPDGAFIHIDEFAGVMPGSEIFLKNDIFSIIKLAESI